MYTVEFVYFLRLPEGRPCWCGSHHNKATWKEHFNTPEEFVSMYGKYKERLRPSNRVSYRLL